ncbi:MAG: flagellar basal body rod protein FlgB [Planctomycetes bacterium]|nr:flagellar basal body rod protein FlgB [Planctomycetota bacterium]
MNIGGEKFQLLSRLLDASSLRGRVIAGNLANMSTPGFKRREVQFEDQLLKALGKNDAAAARLLPEVVVDELTPGNPDGNNVNMELEMNAMREQRLTYETYATILENNLGMIQSAISEGR